jgi:signal transduction histidine kinase
LLSNAIKFTEKGKITVRVKKEKNKGVVSVKDTGRGISKEDLPKIFDRFFRGERSRSKIHTNEKGGLGVGLTIVKELVEAMNGDISVKSEEGKGTEFTVYFPLAK